MSQVVPPPAALPIRSTTPILRALGLRKSFKMGDQMLTVVKGVDLSLRPGEFVAIEGRSGSGKSTLLHMLGALEASDEGTLEFEGRDYTRRAARDHPLWIRVLTSRWVFWGAWACLAAAIVASIVWLVISPDSEQREMAGLGMLTPAEMTAFKISAARAATVGVISVSLLGWFGLLMGLFLVAGSVRLTQYLVRDRASALVRNRDFGFVFQFYHLLPELNVLENTMLSPMIQYSWTGFFARRAALRQRAESVLDQLGMAHRLRHRPSQLSGGERQRVAIARALMNSPRVLFADEPTGNLDLETGKQIMAVLEKLHQEQGQTIVMVTHDRSLARRADRVLVMKDGKLERAEM